MGRLICLQVLVLGTDLSYGELAGAHAPTQLLYVSGHFVLFIIATNVQ